MAVRPLYTAFDSPNEKQICGLRCQATGSLSVFADGFNQSAVIFHLTRLDGIIDESGRMRFMWPPFLAGASADLDGGACSEWRATAKNFLSVAVTN